MPKLLAIDIGATKIAWAQATNEGELSKKQTVPSPKDPDRLRKELEDIIRKEKPSAVGISIAGAISADHTTVQFSKNLPEIGSLELKKYLEELCQVPVRLDNDARCALIGEVWKGVAQETSSAVLLTLGTGVGGAVMQRHKILPHSQTLEREIGYLIADSTDLLPYPTGKGSIEALIGGKSVEERFGFTMKELAQGIRKGNTEIEEIWETLRYYFQECIAAIYNVYSPKMVIIGGRGSEDFEFYVDEEDFLCPVVKAQFGTDAELVGAARLALDELESLEHEKNRDWDE